MTRLVVAMLAVAVMPVVGADRARVRIDLDEIGRVATAMVDGDVCQRIVTKRAVEFMSRVDTRDRWADADNYDVNDAAFIATKKTLMRLSSLAAYPVDVNLWMPAPGTPPRIQVAIRNKNEMSQFWKWGALTQPMFPDMQTVLESGHRITVERKAGYVSVLAPVRNSLDEIIGLVEVVSQLTPNARENVK